MPSKTFFGQTNIEMFYDWEQDNDDGFLLTLLIGAEAFSAVPLSLGAMERAVLPKALQLQ